MGTPVPRRDRETPKINNEVITYRLSPEEIAARYGPPVKRNISAERITATKLLEAVRYCDGYEEAAGMLGVSVQRLKYELTTKNIQPCWGEIRKVDCEEMVAFEVYKPDARMDTAGDRAVNQKKKTGPEHGLGVTVKNSYDIADEDVEWAVPFAPARNYPVLVVANDNIRLNSLATCAMLDAGIRSLRIGVAKGKVILKPDSGKDCYKIGRSGRGQKGTSGKLGGRALCNFVINRGITPGKYALTWNEDKGWWETGGREE